MNRPLQGRAAGVVAAGPIRWQQVVEILIPRLFALGKISGAVKLIFLGMGAQDPQLKFLISNQTNPSKIRRGSGQ